MTGNVIHGMPSEQYQRLRALNAGGVIDIALECPAYYWDESPFNPSPLPPKKPRTDFDVGSVIHLLMLEPAETRRRVFVLPGGFDDWRTKAAAEMRKSAAKEGMIALLQKEHDQAKACADAIRRDPVARLAFAGSWQPEVTMTWNDPDYPDVPCKLRVDLLPEGMPYMVDIKSSITANPNDWERTAAGLGKYQRAAWYLSGCEVATGTLPSEYWFILVGVRRSPLVSVIKYKRVALEWGHQLNRYAVAKFAECMGTGDWHSYRPPGATWPRAFEIDLPGYVVTRLRELVEGGQIREPRSRTELERDSLKRRLAARLQTPSRDLDYTP